MLDAAHARDQTESITPDHECGELTEWAVSFNDEVDGPNVVCRYVRPWDVCRNSFGGGAHIGEWEERGACMYELQVNRLLIHVAG